MAEAYPLTWPQNWQRTPDYRRTRGRFSEGGREVTVAGARTRLADELDRMEGITDLVLSTNIVLRADGQPRSGQGEPRDPGAAVYFRTKGVPTVLACDRYTRVADNLAALAAVMAAKRAIIRHGVVTVEQEFRGYAALAAPAGWRELLGNPSTLAEAEAEYTRLARTTHPDRGGTHGAMTALNAAREAARLAFGRGG